MSKTIIVVGYGVGISAAVAEKFGSEGFQVALVARSADRLEAAVKTLGAKGIKAAAFPTDVSDLAAVKALVGKVRETLGPVTAIHWNAYGGAPGDLLSMDPALVSGAIGVSTNSIIAALQPALADLEAAKGALLVTNGGFGLFDPKVDAYTASMNAGPLALANSAKHKLVGVLHHQLKAKNVYAADLVVTQSVKGTAWDNGTATLEPSAIAAKFWSLYSERTEQTAMI